MRFPCFPGLAMPVVLALAVLGCSPALDWREVRPDDALMLLFPCKPERHTRQVTIEGERLSMSLASCAADGQTFALAFLDAPSPERLDSLMQTLQHGLRENVAGAAVTPPVEPVPFSVKGATPHALAFKVSALGKRVDGEPLRAEAGFFRRGLRIYQVTVIGRVLDGESLETFFASLTFSS
jgi:hypothetical protein